VLKKFQIEVSKGTIDAVVGVGWGGCRVGLRSERGCFRKSPDVKKGGVIMIS